MTECHGISLLLFNYIDITLQMVQLRSTQMDLQPALETLTLINNTEITHITINPQSWICTCLKSNQQISSAAPWSSNPPNQASMTSCNFFNPSLDSTRAKQLCCTHHDGDDFQSPLYIDTTILQMSFNYNFLFFLFFRLFKKFLTKCESVQPSSISLHANLHHSIQYQKLKQ